MLSFDVNWLAILVCGVAAMLLGMTWYSDAMFGKQWRAGIGLSDADLEKARKEGMGPMMPSMIGGLLSNMVMAFFLVNFLAWVGYSSVGEAMQIAFWLWLGFFAMNGLGSIFWEKKTFGFYAINAGYMLVWLMIISAILAAWV